jgi:uncharacterized OB-fold protein
LNEAVSAMYPNSTLALHRRRVAPRSNPSHWLYDSIDQTKISSMLCRKCGH